MISNIPRCGPALDVKITANFKRIFDHLSMGIDLSAGAVHLWGSRVYRGRD